MTIIYSYKYHDDDDDDGEHHDDMMMIVTLWSVNIVDWDGSPQQGLSRVTILETYSIFYSNQATIINIANIIVKIIMHQRDTTSEFDIELWQHLDQTKRHTNKVGIENKDMRGFFTPSPK